MNEVKIDSIGVLLIGLVLPLVGSFFIAAGAVILVAGLSIYGLPFTLALLLINALLHAYAGSALLGLTKLAVIGYTLGFVARLLRKVL